MSLTWGSWSTPAVPDPTNTAELTLRANHPSVPPSSEEMALQCTISLFTAIDMSQQDMLDLMAPLYDALVSSGWLNVSLSQTAGVERSAS